MWMHRSGLTLAHVMACYLMAPSHYPKCSCIYFIVCVWRVHFLKYYHILPGANELKKYKASFPLTSITWSDKWHMLLKFLLMKDQIHVRVLVLKLESSEKTRSINYVGWFPKITYPFPNFKGVTVEVWEWKGNFIPHFTMNAITYPTNHICKRDPTPQFAILRKIKLNF